MCLMWSIYEHHSIGVVILFYYIVHYILMPISAFKAANTRLMNISYTTKAVSVIFFMY